MRVLEASRLGVFKGLLPDETEWIRWGSSLTADEPGHPEEPPCPHPVVNPPARIRPDRPARDPSRPRAQSVEDQIEVEGDASQRCRSTGTNLVHPYQQHLYLEEGTVCEYDNSAKDIKASSVNEPI
jgi:hypothetical protein